MDAYDLYKPLRNHLRRQSLLQSLGAVRAYLQNFQFGQEFPRDIEVDRSIRFARSVPERGVFEWELEILAKEIILNSPDQGGIDLRRWSEFATAVNNLKHLENALSQRYHHLVGPNILVELYRISHRQFHWQVRPNQVVLTRYYKIFGHPKMDALLTRETGLSAKTLYTLGLMFAGLYLDKFGHEDPITVNVPWLTKEQLDLFVSRFSRELGDIRELIRANQSYDQDFVYTFNPLKAFPLVWVTLQGKRTLIAPVPTYLFRRFTEGVYYELCDKPGFSAAFGETFQAYVGEVIAAIGAPSRLRLLAEQRYRIGKNKKHSIDWIVSDDTGHLFVECKTKKLTARAKMALASTEALDEELVKMAGFVVQAYKTLIDAKAGQYPHWKSDGLPIFPMVVTLEDWFTFGERILSSIDERVREGFVAAGIDPSIRGTHPYAICSVSEFEQVIQVLNQVGIGKGMPERFVGERGRWLTSLALQDAFPEALKGIRAVLFPKEAEEIGMPKG